jgi:hypothetical protein
MNRIPIDVCVKHILPSCFVFGEGTSVFFRKQFDYATLQFGLKLRTVSSYWRHCLDRYQWFWIEIILARLPRPFGMELKETTSAVVLGLAKEYHFLVLSRKLADVDERISLNDTRISDLRRQFKQIRRQLTEFEDDSRKLKVEQESYRIRIKKLKG